MAIPTREDLTEVIKREALERARKYYNYNPGTEKCWVKPLTLKRLIPAIVLCLVFIGLLIWAVLGIFPAYYP